MKIILINITGFVMLWIGFILTFGIIPLLAYIDCKMTYKDWINEACFEK